MTAAIACSDLSFSWPDGASVLSGLTVSFGPGRTGLIGVNGSGKSTLLKLIAGELRPGSGAVRTHGEVGYLPQAITLGTHQSVSDLLGITAARDALHAIEAGETGEDVFAVIGDDWDVEERPRLAGPPGPGPGRSRRPGRAAIRRGDHRCRAGRAVPAPPGHHAAGRAD